MPEPDLTELAAEAATDGREAVVGALILDDDGRVFVHRRSLDRLFLPGAWDIVGGHVEAGETLLAALARETHEETGWQLVGDPCLVHVCDWETDDPGGPRRRREFDFITTVDGDLSRPRLEVPKHTEFRWIGRDDLDVLDETRHLDGGFVRRLVELGLRSARPGSRAFPHATVFLPATAALVEEWRRRWDPASAHQIASHVSVIYPGEAGDIDELERRIRAAVTRVAPFRLRLAEVRTFADPTDGVYVAVHDVDGGWAQLRHLVTGADDGALPHATVVHPRTTNRGGDAWSVLQGAALDVTFSVDAVAVTAFDGRRWPTVAEYALGPRFGETGSG